MEKSLADLRRVVEILDRENIKYWICHGTLLGIIRENRLLPWDNDIDIGVFSSEISKINIKKLLVKNGFLEIRIACEPQCLHFAGSEKLIDINLYEIKDGQAFMKWLAPNTTKAQKLIFLATNALIGIMPDGYHKKSWLLKFSIYFLLLPIFVAGRFLPNGLIDTINKIAVSKLNLRGYSYPVSLMAFKKIDFMGFKISVPYSPIEVLKLTYGNDWEKPDPNYIWHQDSPSLR